MNIQPFPFCVLLILDGWGEAPMSPYNAIKLANTPNIDYIAKHSFHTFLEASGEAVGLPKGTIGNSEVGHLHIGAGRQVKQEVLKITESIENGKFYNMPELVMACEYAKSHHTNIHLIGLISDALVHSSLRHVEALLKTLSDHDIHENVFIHGFTDGRDTTVDSAYQYVNQINGYIQTYHLGEIRTISGRYYAMDRDQRWDRIKKAYDAITATSSPTPYFPSAIEGIRASYKKEVYDEFVEPFRITHDNDPLYGLIKPKDVIIFFNFREDRGRQMTKALNMPDFNEFSREYLSPYMVTMTEYEKDLCEHVIFEKDEVYEPWGALMSHQDAFTFKIAETEKYAHVTYFFNGGREVSFPLEDRFLIPSLKISTYDLKPQMRVFEITDELIERIGLKKYRLLVANFANADMVGHSGILPATVKACEYVDACIGNVMKTVFEHNGLLVITADHGNAEIKYDEKTKEVSTAHTTNPVPLYIVAKDMTMPVQIEKGSLGDIAPTILPMLNLTPNVYMTGTNLLHML